VSPFGHQTQVTAEVQLAATWEPVWPGLVEVKRVYKLLCFFVVFLVVLFFFFHLRLGYRQGWDRDFTEYLKTLDKKKPVILCGDLNVAHKEIGK